MNLNSFYQTELIVDRITMNLPSGSRIELNLYSGCVPNYYFQGGLTSIRDQSKDQAAEEIDVLLKFIKEVINNTFFM